MRKRLERKSIDLTTALPRVRRPEQKRCRWVRIPYAGDLSDKIGRLMKPRYLKPAYYSVNTIRSLLFKLKDPVAKAERSGVCRLPCNDCNAVYIGETGRQFQIRLHEHLDGKPQDSAFAQHLQEEI